MEDDGRENLGSFRPADERTSGRQARCGRRGGGQDVASQGIADGPGAGEKEEEEEGGGVSGARRSQRRRRLDVSKAIFVVRAHGRHLNALNNY